MDTASATDAALLAAFAGARDQAAFAELVRRHARLVHGVCRRVLAHEADADDAAQAVFLTLARKAAALAQERTIAPWLHHVARCVARNARVAAQARTRREQEAAAMTLPTHPGADLAELRAHLDQELAMLPKHHREAVILVHLEERSLADTAAILGRPIGTIGTWLSRGRERLRARLARRHGMVDAAALGAALAPLPMPPGFDAGALADRAATATASSSALALSHGALHMLRLAKIKAAAATLAVLAVLATGGVLGARAMGAADDAAPHEDQQDLRIENQRLRAEIARLKRDSVEYAIIDRSSWLQNQDAQVLFGSDGSPSVGAREFFNLTATEDERLTSRLGAVLSVLAEAYDKAGVQASQDHGAVTVALPALDASTPALRYSLRNSIMLILGAERGQLFCRLLEQDRNDSSLLYGRCPQRFTISRAADGVRVRLRNDHDESDRTYPLLPWRFALLRRYLPPELGGTGGPADQAPRQAPPGGGF